MPRARSARASRLDRDRSSAKVSAPPSETSATAPGFLPIPALRYAGTFASRSYPAAVALQASSSARSSSVARSSAVPARLASAVARASASR